MKLSDFDYALPKELIAQYPLKKRDDARLMVLDRRRQDIKHCLFHQIGRYLKSGDLLVLNDTKVLPCRLIGRRLSGGRVEALLAGVRSGMTFRALLKPARLRIDEKIIFDHAGLTGTKSARDQITFDAGSIEDVYRHGKMPLPPYIKREAEARDAIDYQTVYADKAGAVASPTAGLHFTRELMQQLRSQGTDFAFITLHVGLGTFKPVKSEDINAHKMEAEYFSVPVETQDSLSKASRDKRRVIAVGTTSLRALEAYAGGCPGGYTGLFIYPGYKFKAAGSLLTNFHLPRTTLFMLACAFAGTDFLKEAYALAIENKYRFYSYGDAMLII